MRSSAGRPCTHISRDGKSCPNLQPCETHNRPTNGYQPWGSTHDAKQHMALRRRVIAVRGPRCQRCDYHAPPDGKGLHMHHIRPGYSPDAVVLLCAACHRELDRNAR
jgi:hypothetical protein